MSDELKPCPFCGSDALSIKPNIHTGLLRVQCEACWAVTATSVSSNNRKTAIAAWNRRPDITDPAPADTAKVRHRISDERLASLAAAYGKMSFEKSFGDMASAFRELIAARSSPRVEEVREMLGKMIEEFDDATYDMNDGSQSPSRKQLIADAKEVLSALSLQVE